MKIVFRILSVFVVLVILAAGVVYVWGEPISRMPGRHLHGNVIAQPVDDWSFAASPHGTTCQFEVDSDSPQAVNIACIGQGKDLYVGHLVRSTKRVSWAERLANSTGSARVRFGKDIYPVSATQVTDPAERQRLWDSGYTMLHGNGQVSPPDAFLLFKLKSR